MEQQQHLRIQALGSAKTTHPPGLSTRCTSASASSRSRWCRTERAVHGVEGPLAYGSARRCRGASATLAGPDPGPGLAEEVVREVEPHDARAARGDARQEDPGAAAELEREPPRSETAPVDEDPGPAIGPRGVRKGCPSSRSISAVSAISRWCAISRVSRVRPARSRAAAPHQELQLSRGEGAHLQQQPAVAEARDVGLAVAPLAVAHGEVHDAQVEPRRRRTAGRSRRRGRSRRSTSGSRRSARSPRARAPSCRTACRAPAGRAARRRARRRTCWRAGSGSASPCPPSGRRAASRSPSRPCRGRAPRRTSARRRARRPCRSRGSAATSPRACAKPRRTASPLPLPGLLEEAQGQARVLGDRRRMTASVSSRRVALDEQELAAPRAASGRLADQRRGCGRPRCGRGSRRSRVGRVGRDVAAERVRAPAAR